MASSTQALCLLALIATFAHVGAAAAAGLNDQNKINNNNNKIKPIPGSCLMAASTLCANADTNAMRCLRKLAITGDARVPSACSEALMASVTMNPRRNQASRASRLSRMLSEGGGGACGVNTCPNSFATVSNNRCNDVLNGCSGCETFTIMPGRSFATVVDSFQTNPNGYACSNICCKDAMGAPACCFSFGGTTATAGSSGVYCNNVDQAYCTTA